MRNKLTKFGFEQKICPFTGRNCYVYDSFNVPHIDLITDRFVFYSDTNEMQDFKLLLPPKIVNNIADVKRFIKYATYFDN